MTQDLTTLARFKAWYNLPQTKTNDDELLADLITSASHAILAHLQRPSLFKNTYTDYLDGNGGKRLMLRNWPAISLTSCYVDAVALTAITTTPAQSTPAGNTVFLDPYDGWPPGRMQFINNIYGTFCRGLRNVSATYVAGYCIQNESATVGASPYQATAAETLGAWAQDDGVTLQSTGAALTKVTSSPATGQYMVEDGLYTFNAAQTGVAVYLNYSFVPAAVQQACNKMVGEQYAYRQRIGQKAHTLAGNTTVSFDNTIMTPPIQKKLNPFQRKVPF